MARDRDDGMPVPKGPMKPTAAVRGWPAATIAVCLVLTSPLLWLWYHADASARRAITWAVVLGVPVVSWTLLGCLTPVRRRVKKISLRMHLIPAAVADKRSAAILPVCAFVGSYVWWVVLFSGGMWAIFATLIIFAVPAIPMMADPDYHRDLRPR